VKFLLDECLSHTCTARLAVLGYPDTIHPIHVGFRASRDDQIAERAFADDRILISANGRDFRKLLATRAIYPGAILVEGLDFELTWRQMCLAIECIQLRDNPGNYMINGIVEVSVSGGVQSFTLPVEE
jgi:predicted nuclease of predicted toxin-antitoxin system